MKKENISDEHQACVRAFDLDISTKFAVEISQHLRYRQLSKAKKILLEVISQKKAIPFRRYNRDLGHKPGQGSARYPIKASKVILKLLEQLEANSEFKGLDTNNLVISKMVANVGSTSWHFGRKRRRRAKKTNLEIFALEKKT